MTTFKKGELHFSKKSGDVLLSGDVDGNGKADFAILLADLNKVVKGDFCELPDGRRGDQAMTEQGHDWPHAVFRPDRRISARTP